MQPSATSRPLRVTGQCLTLLLFGVTLFSIGTTGRAKAKREGEKPDLKQLSALERKIQSLYTRLAPSVVRFANDQGSKGSGVIVTSDGEIATCAHNRFASGTKLTVFLADGRRVKGTFLGRHDAYDVGLIRLDDKGPWPAVPLGRSAGARSEDLCLAMGYPYILKQEVEAPLLRLGRVVLENGGGTLITSCQLLPGDSGGGLFDMEGRLIGIHIGGGSERRASTSHVGSDVFTHYRDRLRAGEHFQTADAAFPERDEKITRYLTTSEMQATAGPFAQTEGVQPAARAASRSVVEVTCENRLASSGLIVRPDGWIVTKRSEIAGRIFCRLADGRRLEARVAGGSWEHDIALLKIQATGLPVPRWGRTPRVGQILLTSDPASAPPTIGVVCAARTYSPGVKGFLPINIEAQSPIKITGMWAGRPEAEGLLQPGDLLTHIEGQPVPTLEEYLRIRNNAVAAPNALMGERITLTVRRGQETLQVGVPIVPEAMESAFTSFHLRHKRISLRRNGFPQVFAYDGRVMPDRCGGPVVDLAGRVVGVNIARADTIRTFAVPADVVQKVIADLLAQADKK
jgi:serine protease Do